MCQHFQQFCLVIEGKGNAYTVSLAPHYMSMNVSIIFFHSAPAIQYQMLQLLGRKFFSQFFQLLLTGLQNEFFIFILIVANFSESDLIISNLGQLLCQCGHRVIICRNICIAYCSFGSCDC